MIFDFCQCRVGCRRSNKQFISKSGWVQCLSGPSSWKVGGSGCRETHRIYASVCACLPWAVRRKRLNRSRCCLHCLLARHQETMRCDLSPSVLHQLGLCVWQLARAYWNPGTIVLPAISPYLYQSWYHPSLGDANASDSFSRFLALYKFVCMSSP